MQKEFTKEDLKDGMVLVTEDGRKAVRVSMPGYYVKDKDIKFANGEIMTNRTGEEKRVCRIEYGDKVIWEIQTKRMTAEEMRKKLEELTGEKIEVEPSREEMMGKCYTFCSNNDCISGCILRDSGSCVFTNYSDERLKECYEKVMEDEL